VRFLGTDPKPDPDIARDVIAAIQFHAPDAGNEIRVTVDDGWVTLDGIVESDALRARVEEAVRSARGLKGITNRIRVAPAVPSPS
jgi:osmotically-inducible protein OsmY